MAEISQYENATTGDILDLHYSIRGFGKQGQMEELTRKLNQDPRWSVVRLSFKDESHVVIRMRVDQNPFPIILIVAAVGAIGTGIFLWLSLDKVEKITASPTIKIGILAVAALTLFLIIPRLNFAR